MRYNNELINTDLNWYSPDLTEEEFYSINPVCQMFISQNYLYTFFKSLLYQSIQFGYDRFYVLDLGANNDKTVMMYGTEQDDYDSIFYEDTASRLGSVPTIDLFDNKAAKATCAGSVGDVSYGVIYDDDGTAYYAGYIFISDKDEHRYTLCVLYNWSGFRQRLDNTIIPSIIICGLLIVVANILLIRFLYVRSIRPVTRIQKNVREYTDTKDSGHIINELSKITAKNEFGVLATDVSNLAAELERYTNEIANLAAEQERVSAELELASKIQSSSLPTKFPAFPERNEFELFASMDPAKEVGGDFYDFFLIDDDHLALVIADVSGKGVPAALFMMSSKIFIQNYALMGGTPDDILVKVNNQISTQNPENMFVTVWLGILEISTGKMTCCNAGHEYPALRRAGGKFEIMREKHGLFIGEIAGIRYKNYEIQFERGDTLFVYTDGVPEATNAELKLFGEDRMAEALNSVSDVGPDELLQTVRKKVDEFVGDAPQFDDLTMMAFRYLGKDDND